MPGYRNRTIWIRNPEDKLISSRMAPSLKAALQNYYRDTLIQQGYRDPIYKGNTLTVTYKRKTYMYTALEAK